jgi:hypothetical protein
MPGKGYGSVSLKNKYFSIKPFVFKTLLFMTLCTEISLLMVISSPKLVTSVNTFLSTLYVGMPTFADRGCHVVSATDPPGR